MDNAYSNKEMRHKKSWNRLKNHTKRHLNMLHTSKLPAQVDNGFYHPLIVKTLCIRVFLNQNHEENCILWSNSKKIVVVDSFVVFRHWIATFCILCELLVSLVIFRRTLWSNSFTSRTLRYNFLILIFRKYLVYPLVKEFL